MLLDVRRTPLHEGANGRGGRVENRHTVPLADLPEAIFVGPVGGAFVHHLGGTIRQRAVYQIRMPGDPADVGGAPVHVVFFQVEHVLGGARRAGEVAAGGVDDALRLSRRPRRVQDEQQVFGVHHLGFAILRHLPLQAVPPVIAPIFHLGKGFVAHAAATAHHHQHVLDGGALLHRFVSVALERHNLSATIAAVGGNEHLAAAVVNAVAQRLR